MKTNEEKNQKQQNLETELNDEELDQVSGGTGGSQGELEGKHSEPTQPMGPVIGML